MKSIRVIFYSALGVLFPFMANAASLEGTLSSLVSSFLSRILPILALGYLGKNIFGHIQNDPNAKNETPRVVIACAMLLAINGVWSFIQSNIR
jgi:hypothetical protein